MKPTHNILFGLVAASTALIAGSVTIPHSFTANTTAKASEVNANFSAVKTAVDGNAGDIATNKSGIATNKTNITTNANDIATNKSDITTNANGVARGGLEVTAPTGYNVIYAGGRAWLDRNVGATAAPTAWNDTTQASLGSLFQWGRKADGHQFRDIASSNNDSDVMATTGAGTASTECALGDVAPANKFITGANASGGFNWSTTGHDCNTDAKLTYLWSAPGTLNGGICPTGWRVPSEQDFASLDITSAEDAYSKIKLSASGYRDFSGGAIYDVGSYGYYWTSTVERDRSRGLDICSGDTYFDARYRAQGYSVRCVKHLNN